MSLFSRVLSVSVLACAAVVPFIMGLHAAKADHGVAPLDSGEQPFMIPHAHFSVPSSGLGHIARISSRTAQSWRDSDRDTDRPVNLLRNEHSGYNPKLHNNQPLQPMSLVHRGQHMGGVKSASGTSTHSDPQLLRMNHNSFLHERSQNGPTGLLTSHSGNPPLWHLPIIRKSAQQERPVSKDHAMPTQFESRSEARINWKSPDKPTVFRSGAHWSSEQRGDTKETHDGAGAVRASQAPSFFPQRHFIAPSVSNSKDSSVTKTQKPSSAITQFSQGDFPPSGKTSYRRIQSSLLGHSHTSDAPKGVNAPNPQLDVYKGQDLDQQTRPNLKSVGRSDHQAAGIFRAPKTSTLIPVEYNRDVLRNAEDARSGQAVNTYRPGENRQLREGFSLNKGLKNWPTLKTNNPSSTHSKEASFESSIYRVVRPSFLQKYSFERRIPSTPSSQEKILQHPSEVSDATTPNSSAQESGSPDTKVTMDNYDPLSAEQKEEKVEPKSVAKSANISISAPLNRVKPKPKQHGNTQGKNNAAKEFKYKAMTYEDIIGRASFSSVTPAKIVQDEAHFEKLATTIKQREESGVVGKTVASSQTNGSKDDSVDGKTFDFRKGEAMAELRTLAGSASEEGSEAKRVPHEPLSDSEENIESDSLLELDYLRTSTGNVSFQSLNLNL